MERTKVTQTWVRIQVALPLPRCVTPHSRLLFRPTLITGSQVGDQEERGDPGAKMV